MKNKSVRLLLALLSLGVLTGVYFGVKTYVARQEKKEAEAEEEADQHLFSADVDSMVSVEFVIDGDAVLFEKTEDVWYKSDEKEFPVSQDTITNAIGNFVDIVVDRTLSNVENFEEYGLDEPDNTISIVTSNGETHTMQVGILNKSTDQYYVKKESEEDTVYLVSSVYVEPFMNSLYDYAEAETFPTLDTSAVNKVVVQKRDFSYTIKLDDSTGFWDAFDDENDAETADTTKVSNVVSAIGTLEYDAFVDYNADDLSEYGLDEPYAVVTVDYTEKIEVDETGEEFGEESVDSAVEESEEVSGYVADEADDEFATEESKEDLLDAKTIEIENSDSAEINDDETVTETETVETQLVIYIGDSDGKEGRYVRVNDSSQIYTIPIETLNSIVEKDASDFWSLSVNYVSVNVLDTLHIQVDGSQTTVNVSRETSEDEDGNETETLSYELNGEKIESINFTTFYNKLINIVAQERVAEIHKTKETPAMSIEFINTDGNSMTAYYYERDTNFYTVVVGEKTYVVNKMTVREVMNAYEDMLKKISPDFQT